MSRIRILHISDLHFRASSGFDEWVIAERMFDDVAAQSPPARPIDLIVFGGDLTFAGQREGMELGKRRVLDPLMERLGLTPDRVVLVAGNHDIDRGRVEKVYE